MIKILKEITKVLDGASICPYQRDELEKKITSIFKENILEFSTQIAVKNIVLSKVNGIAKEDYLNHVNNTAGAEIMKDLLGYKHVNIEEKKYNKTGETVYKYRLLVIKGKEVK